MFAIIKIFSDDAKILLIDYDCTSDDEEITVTIYDSNGEEEDGETITVDKSDLIRALKMLAQD